MFFLWPPIMVIFELKNKSTGNGFKLEVPSYVPPTFVKLVFIEDSPIWLLNYLF